MGCCTGKGASSTTVRVAQPPSEKLNQCPNSSTAVRAGKMGESYRTIVHVRTVEYPSSIEIRVRLGYIMKCYERRKKKNKDQGSWNQTSKNARLALRVY